MLQIILADDERTIREGMARLIDSFQLPVSIAYLAQNGLEALEMIEEIHPELLIIDINMPHMNGLETIEKVRNTNPDMKIIIVSGYDNFSYAQKALELGVFSYLLKPLDIVNFKQVLESAIDGYEKRLLEIGLLNKHGYRDDFTTKGDEIKSYLKNHYQDSDITLNQMAEHFCVSTSTMAKLIKKRTGFTFSESLNQLRIEASIGLLLKTEMSINDISFMVGYSSQHYFSRIFKKYKGVSPENFRNSER